METTVSHTYVADSRDESAIEPLIEPL